VLRAVVEGEGRALAGAVQRGAAGDAVPPLDVERRQRLQAAADLREREVAEVARLQGGPERVVRIAAGRGFRPPGRTA
jgi:hypothetical protein